MYRYRYRCSLDLDLASRIHPKAIASNVSTSSPPIGTKYFVSTGSNVHGHAEQRGWMVQMELSGFQGRQASAAQTRRRAPARCCCCSAPGWLGFLLPALHMQRRSLKIYETKNNCPPRLADRFVIYHMCSRDLFHRNLILKFISHLALQRKDTAIEQC